ncbi:arginase [Boseaceae bacterium BT-24-1]|nr:arginase [Boseaceae bacterium BT-24-1]
MRLRVIDLDRSMVAQPPLAERVDDGRALCIDLRDLAPSLRLVASGRAMWGFLSRVQAAGLPPGTGPEVTFYGSGDFHHLTAALLMRLDRPVTVVHLDNHPDWTMFPRTFNCGAWVNRALELATVTKVITIGPCSHDLSWPELKAANLSAIASGRLEVYPWRHRPSRVIGRYSGAPGSPQRDGKLVWRNVGGADWPGFLNDLPTRIDTRDIWITLDKDVLSTDEAVTNWDQGDMTVAQVIDLVRMLAGRFRIAGMDVCGDYSPSKFRDPYRMALAALDLGSRRIPTTAAWALNPYANARLLALFDEVLP